MRLAFVDGRTVRVAKCTHPRARWPLAAILKRRRVGAEIDGVHASEHRAL